MGLTVEQTTTGREAIARDPAALFAWKGEALQEHGCDTERALYWGPGFGPDLFVGKGGDATLLIHDGVKAEEEFIKFNDFHGRLPSLPYGWMRGTDSVIAGKVVIVCWYGDVGKAHMEGLQVLTDEDVLAEPDIFVTATGNKDIIMNLGCATGHPSFVMSCPFTNQVNAQLELWKDTGEYEKKVYVLPKHLDEKVAALHFGKLGAKLTILTKDQADYISIMVEGPYKPAHYRY